MRPSLSRQKECEAVHKHVCQLDCAVKCRRARKREREEKHGPSSKRHEEKEGERKRREEERRSFLRRRKFGLRLTNSTA